MNTPIVITGGDPAGVGPELILEIIPQFISSRNVILYFATGGNNHRAEFCKRLSMKGISFCVLKSSDFISITEESDVRIYYIDLTNEGDTELDFVPGKPTETGGRLAWEALHQACQFINKFSCRGLLTAPISKEWVVRGIQKHFSGHTDYLAEYFDRKILMLMHGVNFSVIPLTVHIPLCDVPDALIKTISSNYLINLIKEVGELNDFKGKKMVLCGLNPHSGEGGYLGREEVDYLNFFVEKINKQNISLEGPIAADSLFMPHVLSNYKLILGCYHDQVLTPFKALEGSSGINCSIGLPFPRTSPAHGTAYSIAGKNIASSNSMKRAFEIIDQGGLVCE